MIRSEKNFAGIPIFFLTGRTDPDTVKKLVSLKPNGYLAKYLKPEEIKKKIDAYFVLSRGVESRCIWTKWKRMYSCA